MTAGPFEAENEALDAIGWQAGRAPWPTWNHNELALLEACHSAGA